MLIGWDAADWKIINPLLDKGLMPNLEKIVNNGTIGNLATMDPAYSPMLWTSIATGKHAYKHGIHGFLEGSIENNTLKPILSTSRKVRALWEILSEQDLKTHVVGWWPSHPAEAVNGISISNFYQKPGSKENPNDVLQGSIYPESETERFANLKIHASELTGQHLLPFVPLADRIDQSKDSSLLKIANETAMAATVHAAFTDIIRNEEWDFAAVYLDTIDHYSHAFMKYHPPKQDHVPQYVFDIYKDVVTAGYRFHDMMLGRLLDLAGDDTTVILISDHGFQPDHLRPKVTPDEPGGLAYEHSPYGVIAMMGPDIKQDHIIHGATLLDICPTILSMYDLPVGQDMDGHVLSDAFVNHNSIPSIKSWEEVPFNKFKKINSHILNKEEEDHLVQQLIDLGYVDPMPKDRSKAIKGNDDFNKTNLAKSYMFDGKLIDAKSIFEKLVKDNPETPRYKFHLATCYQGLGLLTECRAIIQQLNQNKYYNPVALQLMEASLMIGERKYSDALKILINLENIISVSQAEIYAKIAKCYMYLGHREQAQYALNKGKEVDYEYPSLHLLQGILYYHKDQHQDAIAALLISIGLDYNNQAAHKYLGMALYRIGDYASAAAALEVCLIMNPKNNMARSKIIDIYKIHLDEPKKAADHRQKYYTHINGEITIVSGLPRSGTSMMMQMLENTGLEIYTDKTRAADINNPKGYYEHESVKSLHVNKKWVAECRGKVVKVISNLLPAMPINNRYKVIMMERDLHEIIASQNRMLTKLGVKTNKGEDSIIDVSKWEQSIQYAKDWARKIPNVELLIVNYADVINEPFAQAIRISEFIGDVDPEKMIEVIDPKLYREKIESLV